MTSNYADAPTTATTTPAELVGYDDSRESLVVFNTSSDTVAYVSLSGLADTWIPVPIEGGFAFEDGPANALQCKTDSGTANLVVWEA